MSDFLSIFTHGRRLQGAVKSLSVEELTDVAEKLNGIIERRKLKDAEQQAADAERQEKIDALKKQMDDAGLDLEDLLGSGGKKSKRTGQKRPVKYILKDANGEHPWTGIGRMPKVYAQALAEGKLIEDFAV